MTTSGLPSQPRLTGDDLLKLIKENEDTPKNEVVRAAGYFKEDGRLEFTAFYEALLEAKGYTYGGGMPGEPVEKVEGKQTVTISFPVITSYVISKVVDDGMSKDEIIDSITREDLSNSEENSDGWGDIKESWRSAEPESIYIYLENGDELEASPFKVEAA